MQPSNEIDKQFRLIQFFGPVILASIALVIAGTALVLFLELSKVWFWVAISPGMALFFGYVFLLIRGHLAWNKAFEAKREQDFGALAELEALTGKLSSDQQSRVIERCARGDNIHEVLAEARRSQSST